MGTQSDDQEREGVYILREARMALESWERRSAEQSSRLREQTRNQQVETARLIGEAIVQMSQNQPSRAISAWQSALGTIGRLIWYAGAAEARRKCEEEIADAFRLNLDALEEELSSGGRRRE